jgi:hypothetical protein
MLVLKAFKCLVDTLSQAIDAARLEVLLQDMQEEELGKSIVKEVHNNLSHESRCKKLIQVSANYGDPGFKLLWLALSFHVDPQQTIRPKLEKAFQAYQDEKRKANQESLPDLTRCMEDNAEHGMILLGRLRALSHQYSQLEPKKLQEAIAKAMEQAFSGCLPKNVFPSVFGNGPIADWADLLSRITPDPSRLDKGFLDALEEALSIPPGAHGHSDSTALSSLIVMVLEPPDLPEGTICDKYAFRAFFCPDEDAEPDQWRIVDAKDAGYPIKAADFFGDLQPSLLKALDCALTLVPQPVEPLLLEIFLPRRFLNMDIGQMITLPVPGSKSEPLSKHYPIVLRSSDRYQNFHERRAKTLQNPLPAKWDWARSAPSPTESRGCWWHDPPPRPKKRLSSMKTENKIVNPEDVMEELFDRLRVRKEFFSFRRVTNLPSCSKLLETWLIQMINSSPAVAIWWRPGAQSSRAQRENSLRFCHAEDVPGFGVGKLSGNKLAHADPFIHPHITTPLKLFHTFASGVFYGRRSDEHALAFSELVLLMESVERWPPRRDFEPAIERKSDERGQVISVIEEEILFSG